MQLVLNNRIMNNILERKDFNEEAIGLLKLLVDREFEKSDDEIDFDFIDECSNAIVEITVNSDNGSNIVFPILTSKRFLSKMGAIGWNSISKGARIIMVAAVIFATTVTANAAVGTVTGNTIFESIISTFTGDDDGEETTTPSQRLEYEVVDDDIENPKDEGEIEETKAHNTPDATTTTLGYKAVFTPKDKELRAIEKKDKDSSTTRSADGSKEFAPYDDDTTYNEKEDLDEKEDSQLDKISVVTIKNQFKSEYELGEKFESKGIYVKAHYNDGSLEGIRLSDCKLSGFDTSTAGTKTVTVTYKNKKATFTVNVKTTSTTAATTETTIETEGE